MIKEASNYDYHQSKINDVCEQNCKSKQQWKDEEICYTKTDYITRHKLASELQERYQIKLYKHQLKENELRQKIKDSEKYINNLKDVIKILETQHFPRKLKRKQNQLKHWIGYLILLEKYLNDNIYKQKRFEYLCNKWTGIFQKIHLANIKNEIRNERIGLNSPYYGFGDNRETTIHIHKDNK